MSTKLQSHIGNAGAAKTLKTVAGGNV